MQGLRSFRFRLHHESGSLELLPGFRVDEVKGDVLNPDQISISLSGSYGTGFAIKASLITLGDDSYMTNPLTGKWEAVATGVSPLGFFNPGRGIAGMMLQVEGVRLLEEQGTTKGVYRLGGNLVAEALAPLVGKTSEGAMVQVELTIDADNLYLLKTRIIGQVTPTDTDRPVRVITISGFDEPVVIEAPL